MDHGYTMDFSTKFMRDLQTINTEVYEEVVLFALDKALFYDNVRNLRKSSLEAFVYVCLMRWHNKLPASLSHFSTYQLTVRDFVEIFHQNSQRLQADDETFRWVLRGFALTVLTEQSVDDLREDLDTLIKDIATGYHRLPLYYDVLRTLLIVAKERPDLRTLFQPLDVTNMIRRLTSDSKLVKLKALACLQTMMGVNPYLPDVWLYMLKNTKPVIEHRSIMLHQLMESLLRLPNGRAKLFCTIQSDHIWPIIIESLAGRVAVCRKAALATLQQIIGYAKLCGQDLRSTYFVWSEDTAQAEQLTNAWQSFVMIAEALNETQTHLILPALEQLDKVGPHPLLHVVWKNLLLRLILLHENPRVANYGLQYFLKVRTFDPTDGELEKQFLQTFNQTTLFDSVAETVAGLKQYYRATDALTWLIMSIHDISWNSVPYYCIVNVMHDHVEQLGNGESEGETVLKQLTNSVRACQDIKNVSLRYVTALLLLKTISRYASRCPAVVTSSPLLAIVKEIEKLSPMFPLSLDQVQEESAPLFGDAITEEALLSHLTGVCVDDTFFIKEVLLRRIVHAEPLTHEHLLKALSESNPTVYFNVLHQLPETLRGRWLHSVPDAASYRMAEIKQHLESRRTITPALFATMREASKYVLSTQEPRVECDAGWREIFSALKTIAHDRLLAFDYAQTTAVQTIQMAHLLAVDLRDTVSARQFFQHVSLEQLKDTFQRHQTTDPSIDRIYGMISDIFLCHCQAVAGSGDRAFATEDDCSKLIALLDVGNIEVLSNVLEMLHTDTAAGGMYDAARIAVIDRSYREILNYRKSDHFMKLIKQFTVMVLRPYTIMVDNGEMLLDDVEIDPKVTGYIEMFLEQASTIYGLANIVFESVFQIPIPVLLNWSTLGKLLLQGMIFGDVQKRDQKTENEVIDHCGLEISFKDHPRYIAQADARVRVLCVLFLYRIVKANHPDAVLFLLKLERMLMERFSQITKSKERYYADSITHRQKLRIVQALCVVLKLTGTKPYPLLEVMLYETNQPNINYLIELIVADSAIDTLTVANSLRNEKVKVSGIQSVFVILWLRCCQTNSLDRQYIYLLLPWTMAQNFSTRLYAQLTITKLIAKFAPPHSAEAAEGDAYREIYAAVNSYLRQGNVERNIEKCMKDFRFNSVFDYGNLLTIENVFHNIPKVSVAPPEDVVGTSILKECLQTLQLGESHLGQPLPFDEIHSERRENLFLAQSFGGADFVQRKIVPLKSLEPSQELLLDLPEKLCLKKMDFTEGLIVVASLVNRAPNLGGLARTSEIFAVKQFVINSLQDMDNKEFQALSMTAEKWLNVGELKTHKMVEYLEEMKAQGYSIVGAEQTTGSRPIQQLRFPKKCILVLGHEKNGLPPEVIQHLDLIGEIPQFGVVRSLNVHVTGAIFMWEYAKQHHVAPMSDE